jgi:hypothetical protein
MSIIWGSGGDKGSNCQMLTGRQKVGRTLR